MLTNEWLERDLPAKPAAAVALLAPTTLHGSPFADISTAWSPNLKQLLDYCYLFWLTICNTNNNTVASFTGSTIYNSHRKFDRKKGTQFRYNEAINSLKNKNK